MKKVINGNLILCIFHDRFLQIKKLKFTIVKGIIRICAGESTLTILRFRVGRSVKIVAHAFFF